MIQVVTRGPSGVLASYDYSLNAAGARPRLVESGPGTTGRIVDYTYDVMNRFVGKSIESPATLLDRNVTYAYDSVGNRVGMTTVSGAGTIDVRYIYDDNDRLISETTSVTPTGASQDALENLAVLAWAACPILGATLCVALHRVRRRNSCPVGGPSFANTFIVCELLTIVVVMPPFTSVAECVGVAGRLGTSRHTKRHGLHVRQQRQHVEPEAMASSLTGIRTMPKDG